MNRKCGACTLCCTLLPVKGLSKPANTRCIHQRSFLSIDGMGCAVYHKSGFPGECALWSCRWLVDDTTSALARPDRSHYVIDIVPDFITAASPAGDARLPVIQLWVDPNFPDAHRDPALRAWVVENAPQCGVLVRYNSSDAIFLVPPAMSDTGAWEEIADDRMVGQSEQTSAEEIAAVLNNSGAMR